MLITTYKEANQLQSSCISLPTATVPIVTGRYKQWNGLLEWNTGLDYWTELFSFYGTSFYVYFYIFPSTWLLWMIVVMIIIVYCSVFINISKWILENTVYCKLLEV